MGSPFGKPCPPRIDLQELVKRAVAVFDALSPSQKLRHRYMQRRSMARGSGSDTTSHDVHCAAVEQRMPHEAGLTDTQIGLILVGASWK